MIIISLLGMDQYYAIDVTKKLHHELINIYGCKDEELLFFAPQSFLIHNGIEQTSFVLEVRIDAPEIYKDKELRVKDYLTSALQDISIHFHFLFNYFRPHHEYLVKNEDYPLYMTEENTVKASVQEEENDEDSNYSEEYDEPYMSDIMEQFDNFLQSHPHASNSEVYHAITNIRDDVSKSHHSHCHCKDKE